MNRYLIILSLMFLLFSCEEKEIIFTGPFHVRFTEESETLKESFSGDIQISVHLVGPQRDEDIVIGYDIGGDAREDIDYRILGDRGEVVIRQGQSFGSIRMELINNANNILESQDVVFTIQSVSAPDLEIGFGPGVKAGSQYTFTIEDDCILGGSYTGINDGFPPSIEGISVFSNDCITYTLSNWDINVFNFQDTRNLQFKDNGDNTLTIPEQEEATLDPSQATIRGDGVVNPSTGEIILNIELVDFDGSPVVTLRFIRE